MRKIIFRGKRKDDIWVYGWYVNKANKYQIVTSNDVFPISVIPETVGQFTGLTDKNGVEIYEGDIVRPTKIPAMDKLKFYADPFEIRYKENGCQFFGYRDGWLHDTYLYSLKEFEYEIIGNIHDNPELLGKEAAE